MTTTLTYARNGWQAGFRGGYALTHTAQERAYNSYAQDIVGKQLPYVPIHTGTGNAWVQHGRTRLNIQMQTNSRRYITFDNSQFFKGVTQVNVLLESTLKWVPYRFGCRAKSIMCSMR